MVDFRLAADHDDAKAQNHLGMMYITGRGVPQDYVQAHMWFNLAAARGDDDASHNRDLLEKRMTSTQVAEAQKRAREWTPNTEQSR